MKCFLVLWLVVLTLSSQAAPNLKEAYLAARMNMETLKRAKAQVEQKEERKDRALAAMLPTLSGVGTYTRLDAPDLVGVNPAFVLTKQYSAALRVQQPLLRGGSIAAYKLAKEDILLSQFQKNASDLSLYQLVINAYYTLYMAQVDLSNLEELMKYSKERVRDLKERTHLGKSRRGELIQAEAQLLTSEAQYQQGRITLQQAGETFEFYTRLKPDPLPPLPPLPEKLEAITAYQEKVKARPDIMARVQQIRVAERQIDISKGSHYPSLDLTGNYYLTRTGILSTSDWDVGLAVVLPLYQGGGVEAAVREAVEMKRVAELDSSEGLRAAERDLTILYQNYDQIHRQLDTLKAALNKAEEAWRLSKRDYHFGQVTNLDVLQSLNLFIETKRSYNNLQSLAHMTYKNLEASIGVLP